MKKVVAVVAVLALSGFALASEHAFSSPGKALKFRVTTGESLRFALDLNGQQVIRPSALGAGPNLQYWADGDEPSKPVCGTATCADGRLKVKLAPGGGYVAIVSR